MACPGVSTWPSPPGPVAISAPRQHVHGGRISETCSGKLRGMAGARGPRRWLPAGGCQVRRPRARARREGPGHWLRGAGGWRTAGRPSFSGAVWPHTRCLPPAACGRGARPGPPHAQGTGCRTLRDARPPRFPQKGDPAEGTVEATAPGPAPASRRPRETHPPAAEHRQLPVCSLLVGLRQVGGARRGTSASNGARAQGQWDAPQQSPATKRGALWSASKRRCVV